MDGTHLGKIKDVSLGFNDRNWFGPEFILSFDGGSEVVDNRHVVPPEYKDSFKSTPEEWQEAVLDGYRFIYAAMKAANVTEFRKLIGKPIEVTIEGNMIAHWRILTEVI